MSDIFLRARVRKRDKDIQQAMGRLKLEEGERADLIRDGVRLRLIELGVLSKPANPTITPYAARLVAKELVRNLRHPQNS